MAQPEMLRNAVLIAGMHRSGTSLLTRILSLQGFALPQTLLQAAKSNETGFWESVPVNRLNDRVLQSVGASWQTWQAFSNEPGHMPGYAGLKQEAKSLVATEFGQARDFVLKDPRLCRLMPFWLEVLNEIGARPYVISPLRNPQETAASLEQRNGIPQPLGQLIWLRYVLDVEKATRGLPRSMPRYSAVIDDWRAAMLKIRRDTGLDWMQDEDGVAEEIGALISPRHRHHQVADAVFLHDPAESKWVRDTYAILLKWSAEGEDLADHKELDRIRGEFSAVPAQLEPVLDAGRKSMDEVRRLRKKLDSLSNELSTATHQIAQREAEATVYAGHFEQTLSKLGQAVRGEGALEGKTAGLERHVAAIEKRWAETEQRLASAIQELARWETEARFKGEQWQESCAIQAEQNARLADFRERIAGLEAALRQQQATEAQLAAVLDEKARWEAEARSMGNQLQDIKSALAEREARLENLSGQLAAQGAEALSNARRMTELAESQKDAEARLAEALYEWGRWEADARLHAEQLQEARNYLAEQGARLEELKGGHAELEVEVTASSLRLRESERQIEATEARLGTALKEWGRWEAEARLKDDQWSETHSLLTERARLLAAYELQAQETAERLATALSESNAWAADAKLKDQQLRDDAGRLADREAELSALSQRLAHLETDLSITIAHRRQSEQDAKAKAAELDRANREIASLKTKLFDGREKLEKTLRGRDIARRDIQRLRAQLEQVRSSWTWRVSRAFVSAGKGALRYLTSGPDVNRERRQATLLENSPYFDRAWYLDQCPQAEAMRMEASLHYLRHGARDGLDPGPGFSTHRYLENNPDVLREGRNPLLHYEQFGRREGREVFPSVRAAPESLPRVHADVDLSEGALALSITANLDKEAPQADALKEWEDVQSPWLSLPEPSLGVQAAWVELWGHRLGWVPTDPSQVGKGLPSEFLRSVALLCRLMDVPAAESLRFNGGVPLPISHNGNEGPDELPGPILDFPGHEVVIESASFVDDLGLRLRFSIPDSDSGRSRVVRFFQYDPQESVPVLVGEAELLHKAVEFADLGLVSAYSPVLATLSACDGHILSATILPFPSLCVGGAHAPEMLATSAAAQGIEGLRSVSRSLLEDLLACLSRRMAWDVGRVFVDLRGASGAEPIFSRDCREWLRRVMRIDLRPVTIPSGPGAAWLAESLAPQGSSDLPRFAEGRLGLVCPPDSIPALHALVAGQDDGGIGRLCAVNTHVVLDRQSGRGMLRVSLPTSMGYWYWAQPESGTLSHPYLVDLADLAVIPQLHRAGGEAPVAVTRRDWRDGSPASLIYPVAPEISWPVSEKRLADKDACQGSITVICSLDRLGSADIRALLESLCLQQRVVVAKVILLVEGGGNPERRDPATDLELFFPGAHQVVAMPEALSFAERCSRLADIVPYGGGILWLNSSIVLHDPRSLAVLWEMAREPEVGSAGCLLVRPAPENKNAPVRFASAGWFPVAEQENAPQVQCAELECLPFLARTTFSVAANSDALVLLRGEVWHQLNAKAQESGTEVWPVSFGAEAARSGLTHVCTTVVSAELHKPLPPPGRFPAQLERRELPVDLHEILVGRCVSIEVLRG